MEKLLYIAVGGGIGSVLRYLLSSWTQRTTSAASAAAAAAAGAASAAGAAGGEAAGPAFPFGTLAVNVLGCLVMGALAAFFAGPHRVRDEVRLGLMVGVLGGFTTFSSFAWETFGLADSGDRGRALTNLLLSNGLCLIAVWIGYRVMQEFRGA